MVSHRVHSSDVYKLYLQAIMSRRVLNEQVAKALWKACTEAIARADPTKGIEFVDSSAEWDGFLDKIKRMLDPLDLEFARFRDEDTGKAMYAITNTKGDEVAQLASDYSPAEIAFFKAVVEQIVLAPRHAFSVSSILALREASHLKGFQMTKSQAEVILTSLVTRGWLAKSKRGRYSLGTRSILELSNYLKNTYDEADLLECVACMELVTKGYKCPTPNCNAPLHRHCYNHIRRRNLCPKCQQEWGNDEGGLIPIGEDAVQDERGEKRRVRRVNGDVGVDGEDGEAEEESQTQTQSQGWSQSQGVSQTQTQTRRRTSKGGKSKKATQTKLNGKSRRRARTPDEDELDDMYDDDDEEDDNEPNGTQHVDDDTVDIDNLAEIRERQAVRNRRSRN